MITASRKHRSRLPRFAAPVAFPALSVFGLLVGMLAHLVFRGWAHSYDSAIYVRSLWGVAHGQLHNPLVDLHVLSIHGNFVLLLLAPLARLVHPALVLVFVQAAAAAATIAMVGAAFRRIAADAGLDRWGCAGAAMFGGFAVFAGTPLVANPFLFDVRPDLLGVPLLTWGLLRAQEKGRFDRAAVGVMLLSLLVREEYAMVIVGGLVLTPLPRDLREDLRLRAAGTAAAVGWFAAYWFGFRNWIGDGSYAIAQEVGGAFLDSSALTLGQVIAYKAEIVGVSLVAVGGTALLGWRWIGAAVPGLALLLVTSRMQDLVLNFHYVQFVSPGVCVAGVAGFARWLELRRNAIKWAQVLTVASIVGSFALSSALPGGGRFRGENFFLATSRDAYEYELLRDAHLLVSQIPDGVGVAMPHELAAAVADRELIVPIVEYAGTVTPTGLRPGIDWVVLPGNLWGSTGRMLVERHGFRLEGFVERRLALLARRPGSLPRWMEVNAFEPPERCAAPLAVWPAAGLTLCGVESAADGRLRISVVRTAPPDSRVRREPMALFVIDPASGAQAPALMLGGLVPAWQIPVGGSGVFATEAGLVGPQGAVEVALLLASGGAVPAVAAAPESPPSASVRVTW